MGTENNAKDKSESSEAISAPNLISQIISQTQSAGNQLDGGSLSRRIHETPSATSGKGAKSDATRIAYVLFTDIVDFSRRSMEEQPVCIEKFQDIVSNTEGFLNAQASDQLICRNTGDGMALVFFDSYLTPVQCAVEISRALRQCPEIGVRMGIYSGPVVVRLDISKQKDVTGDGINMAQRVMDTGDGGHILISKTIADYLMPSEKWATRLHDLGEVEVKHKRRVHLYNLYDEEIGNSRLPGKLIKRRRQRVMMAAIAAALALMIIAGLGFYLLSRDKPTTATAVAYAPPENSVAILPFVSGNSDPAMEVISEELPAHIINMLGNLSDLEVTDRNSASQFKKPEEQKDLQVVGSKLNVRAVLTGRFTQHGDKTSLQVELVDVKNRRHLWGYDYPYQHSEIPSLPSKIATEVSKNLPLKITSEERARLDKLHTKSAVALNLYYEGNKRLNSRANEEELNQSIDFFKRAIAEDENFALPYARLADAYALLTFYGKRKPKDTYDDSIRNANKALELDPQLAEAHTTLGRNKAFYEWDWAGAEREFIQATRLKPSYATAHHLYGEFLTAQGRFDEAAREMQEALKHDLLSTVISADYGGEALFYARRYDEAIAQLKKTIAQDARNTWYPHYLLGWTYVQTGRLPEGIAELKGVRGGTKPEEVRPQAAAMLGYAYALSGNHDEARKIIEELKQLSQYRYVAPYYIATIHAGLGEKEEAIRQLRLAKEDRFMGMVWLKVNPRFDSLRGEEGFKELMREMNF